MALKFVIIKSSKMWKCCFDFFFKKMLCLPKNTSKYMLYLETALYSLFSSTLKINFSYIKEVLQLHSNQHPRILAEHIIELNVFGLMDNLMPRHKLYTSQNSIPLCLHSKGRIDFELTAPNSQLHDLYSLLDYSAIPKPTAKCSSLETSLIIIAGSWSLKRIPMESVLYVI